MRIEFGKRVMGEPKRIDGRIGIMKILKSIGAVLAGFVTVAALSIGADMALGALGIFPPVTRPELYDSWMLLVALAYTAAFSFLGGYVTARLAPSRPLRHVLLLASLGLVGGIAGAYSSWQIMPHWYCVASIMAAPLAAWLGGQRHARKGE